MDLKEFISKTISDIMEGLDDASDVLKSKDKKAGLYSTGKSNQRHIEFDVAVAVENRKGKGGGASIKALSVVEVGGKISSESTSSTVSHIKFGVRISKR